MQICDKQYLSLNISASPSFATAQGRENERRWTKETYDAKNREPGNRYDWSRKHLNFEVKRGKSFGYMQGKKVFGAPSIIPLGTQTQTLKERYEQRLKELDYKPWAKDAPNQPNTCVDFVISGDHDRMTEIAFGKPTDFDWREDNSSFSLADDPDNPGHKQIETMALDYYDFLCRRFGEENVIGLECHLDETTPHFHALVIPVAMRTKRGRVGGYELKPRVRRTGSERPEHITTRQFSRLSEDEQQLYQPAVKKTVPTVSYSHYFGETKFAAMQSYRQWHTMLYEEVGSKWGLERGEDTSLMTAEERKEHRKKTKRQLERERLDASEKLDDINKEISIRAATLHGVNSEIDDKSAELEEARGELDRVTRETVAKSQEKDALQKDIARLASATGIPRATVDDYVQSLSEMKFAVPMEVRNKLNSQLRNHPRLLVANPPLTVEELERIADREIETMISSHTFSNRDLLTKIRAVLTDKQTILFSIVDQQQKSGIAKANRELYLQIKSQMAAEVQKAMRYDELTRKGITEESYKAAVSASRQAVAEKDAALDEARHYSAIEEMLYKAWPGLQAARDVLTDPALDERYMTTGQRDTVKKALRPKPRDSIQDMLDVLKYVLAFRQNITPATRSEAIRLAAEAGIKELAGKGIDLVREASGKVDDIADELDYEVADMANRVASTATCLFFGFVDAATTISESSGGSGGNITELTGWDGRKKDEDDRTFADRCLQTAIAMHTPQYIRQEQKRGRRWGR